MLLYFFFLLFENNSFYTPFHILLEKITLIARIKYKKNLNGSLRTQFAAFSCIFHTHIHILAFSFFPSFSLKKTPHIICVRLVSIQCWKRYLKKIFFSSRVLFYFFLYSGDGWMDGHSSIILFFSSLFTFGGFLIQKLKQEQEYEKKSVNKSRASTKNILRFFCKGIFQ